MSDTTTNLDRIAAALERIAALLEGPKPEEKPKPTGTAGLLPKRYVPHHASILLICQAHLRDERQNRQRNIVDAMKAAGIIAKSTYWKDVSCYDRILRRLERLDATLATISKAKDS